MDEQLVDGQWIDGQWVREQSADEQWRVLTGQTSSVLDVVVDGQPFLLHREVLPHWYNLVHAAAESGFDLQIASAWRGFDRQCAIWNGKARGERTVLDAKGHPLDITLLSDDALLFAMLRWSAIPGCSRHHWGTDLDVYDAAAIAPDYVVKLTTDECIGCGPFAALHTWLDSALQEGHAGFFRPYATDRGGIAPERWHLSCHAIAARYEGLLDEKCLLDWIMAQDIALKERIHYHWRDIFSRYVLVADRACSP